MLAWFISDLHLQDADGEHLQLLRAFLAGPARAARDLFILGDLFEAWVGDDDDSPLAQTVCSELRTLSGHGTRIGLLHGNRDFLLGRDFAARAGARLLPDPCVIDLAGSSTLLTHGDAACVDDLAYQTLRRQLRAPAWQAQFLAQPLAARRAFAAQARQQSAEHQRGMAMELMDVNAAAIEECFRLYGVDRIIHGHTHRPARHLHTVDGRERERWVLSDWRPGQGEALGVDGDGRLERLKLRA